MCLSTPLLHLGRQNCGHRQVGEGDHGACVRPPLHVLQDHDGKNEYVRTLGVALASWQPWMEKIPAVCFVEESCEALLSRMGHWCDVYRTLHGLDNTFDLFLTLPPPRRE